MAKINADEVENAPAVMLCEKCGHDRFQVHERGQLVKVEGGWDVEFDSIACQCLKCHNIMIVETPPKA